MTTATVSTATHDPATGLAQIRAIVTNWFQITPERNQKRAKCRIGCGRRLEPGEGITHWRAAGHHTSRMVLRYGCPACTDRVLDDCQRYTGNIDIGYRRAGNELVLGGPLSTLDAMRILESCRSNGSDT